MHSCRKTIVDNYTDCIVDAYRIPDADRTALKELLRTDPKTRDSVLTGPILRHSVMEDPEICKKAPLLYIFVEIYHQLRRKGLNSVEVTDYVTSCMATFMFSMNWFQNPEMTNPVEYINRLISQLQNVQDADSAYNIHLHIGFFILFLTGLLPEVVSNRHHNGEPDMSLYERIGATHFQYAEQILTNYGMDKPRPVQDLYRSFGQIRQALNELQATIISSIPGGK